MAGIGRPIPESRIRETPGSPFGSLALGREGTPTVPMSLLQKAPYGILNGTFGRPERVPAPA